MRGFIAHTQPVASTSHTVQPVQSPTLQPKYTVPPLPHSRPHEHIEVLVTKQGLLLRPHVVGLRYPLTSGVVRVEWGRDGTVEEVDGKREGVEEENWGSSVIVYGIVGVLQLTFGESPTPHPKNRF
jgi:phosphatidylinositol 4-phosphatase